MLISCGRAYPLVSATVLSVKIASVSSIHLPIWMLANPTCAHWRFISAMIRVQMWRVETAMLGEAHRFIDEWVNSGNTHNLVRVNLLCPGSLSAPGGIRRSRLLKTCRFVNIIHTQKLGNFHHHSVSPRAMPPRSFGNVLLWGPLKWSSILSASACVPH